MEVQEKAILCYEQQNKIEGDVSLTSFLIITYIQNCMTFKTGPSPKLLRSKSTWKYF